MPVVFKNKQYANAADAYDSGDNTSGSIQPVSNGENVNQSVLTRPSENLRLRTEELKRNVKKYEDILQAAGFVSYSYNEAVVPSTVRDHTVDVSWDSVAQAFYVKPSEGAGGTASLCILGAVIPGMKYSITRGAFTAFYESNSAAGSNPNLGLKNPGDSISLRVPLLSAAEANSNPLDLIAANTSNLAVPDAVIGSSLYDLIANNSIDAADGDKALFKSPSKYRVRITAQGNAQGGDLLDRLLKAFNEDLSVAIVAKADGTSYSLDNKTYLVDPEDALSVYLLQSNRAAFPFDTVTSVDYKLDIGGQEYDGTHWSAITLDDVGAPPEEFLIPIASYTGTKIIVHGVGSLDEDDVKNAINSTITLSNTGVASTELGGAIESYESTFRLSDTIINSSDISNDTVSLLDYTSLRVPISLDVPEIATGRQYYLDSIDIESSQDLAVTDRPVGVGIEVQKNASSVGAAGDLGSSHISQTLIMIPSALSIPVSSADIEESQSSVHMGYYKSAKTRIFSGSTTQGNLILESEEDRERTFLLIHLVTNTAAYDVSGASYDLFFRLTFKTVHANELPLLSSYTPSTP